jgi:hypothetical protein
MSTEDRARPGSLCCWTLAKVLPIGHKALNKSINLYELSGHTVYKRRQIPLMTVFHGYYKGPVKIIIVHIKMVPAGNHS